MTVIFFKESPVITCILRKKRVPECVSSPHTAAELHYSQSVTDPDFHMKLPAACGHPFKNKQANKYNFAAEEQSLYIYLSVSSLEHHGKCTVPHKVLPAVLEVSNRLHRDGAATAADADDKAAHKRCSVASNVPSSSLRRSQSHSFKTRPTQFWQGHGSTGRLSLRAPALESVIAIGDKVHSLAL